MLDASTKNDPLAAYPKELDDETQQVASKNGRSQHEIPKKPTKHEENIFREDDPFSSLRHLYSSIFYRRNLKLLKPSEWEQASWVEVKEDDSKSAEECRKVIQSFVALLREKNEYFVDDEFPAGGESVLIPQHGVKDKDLIDPGVVETAWMRLADAIQLSQPNKRPTYCGRLVQGRAYNRYLIDAMSLIGMYPHLINHILVTWSEEEGVYGVRFFKDGRWMWVIVDDQILFDLTTNRPYFAHSLDLKGMWAPIIEKAYAKLHGFYSSISLGGDLDEALVDLTGGIAKSYPVGEFDADWRPHFHYIDRKLHQADLPEGVQFLFCAEPDKHYDGCALKCDHAYGIFDTKRTDYGMGFYRIYSRFWLKENCEPYAHLLPPNINDDSSDDGLGPKHGFFWIPANLFNAMFRTIHEVCVSIPEAALKRTVQAHHNLQPSLITDDGQTKEVYPSECRFEFHGYFKRVDDLPEMRFTVYFPTLLKIILSQGDQRVAHCRRKPYTPIMLRLYQKLGSTKSYGLVCVSAWKHTRDVTMQLSVGQGEFLLFCYPFKPWLSTKEFPTIFPVDRLYFRIISSSVPPYLIVTKRHDPSNKQCTYKGKFTAVDMCPFGNCAKHLSPLSQDPEPHYFHGKGVPLSSGLTHTKLPFPPKQL
eukprot:Platyproteum_vivax@DN2139_c0_g1_i1.p1